jgi:protocatechuate 3,4-dioxygenase beta subunit
MRACIFLVALFFLVAPSGALAQGQAPPAVRTAPLSLSGRALDQQGQPVPAKIYVVSTNGSAPKLLGETLADENGRYEFKDLPLPEQRTAKPTDEYRAGCFQVFGKAPGRAFAWHGMRFLHVNPKPDTLTPQLLAFNRKHGFFAGEPIELDLTFQRPERIQGRILDEKEQPIAGVKVQLGKCDYIDTSGKEDHVNYREFWAMHQAAEVMAEELVATSNEDGRFEFKTVPPGVICRMSFSHPQYANVSLVTSSATKHPAVYQEQPVLGGPINLSLEPVRSILVRVVRADNDQALARVRVGALQESASGSHDFGVSDDEGKLILKLPPGGYTLSGSPPKESDLIQSKQDLTVDAMPAEQEATLRVKLGCVLILKAVDAESGAGIPNVTFSYEMTELPGGRKGRGWTSVQSHTTLVDNPKSNAKGELRAVVAPGTRRYGVGFSPLPDGYFAIDPKDNRPGRLFDLPAGETIVAEFQLRK